MPTAPIDGQTSVSVRQSYAAQALDRRASRWKNGRSPISRGWPEHRWPCPITTIGAVHPYDVSLAKRNLRLNGTHSGWRGPVVKSLFVLNALLTFPFGVLALSAPAALFAQFGLHLDAAGELIARGYGATLVAYGLVLYLQRQSSDGRTVRPFLLSMALFNSIETVIQGIAGVQGIAATMIFGNVAIHAVVAVLSVIALSRRQPMPRTV